MEKASPRNIHKIKSLQNDPAIKQEDALKSYTSLERKKAEWGYWVYRCLVGS